jgi:hypothetical protein
MQARERQMRLRLYTDTGEDGYAPRQGLGTGVLEQSGLADTRLAVNDQRRAAVLDFVEKLVYKLRLSLAPNVLLVG